MPTNNPQSHTQSMQGSKTGAENTGFEGRVERGAERVEKGAEQLASRAEQLANTAMERVRGAREQAESGVMQQRDMVAKRIRRLGAVFRGGSDTLASDDPLAHSLLEMTSDQIERVADYIGEVTPSRIGDDLQSFARRRPGVFFGGAFVLGLALGRFVRSTGRAATSSGEEEFDLELEDESFDDADRYRRPYPGQPMASASPRRDDAAPGTGASMTSASSISGSAASNRPYPSAPSGTSTSSSAGTNTGMSSTSSSAGTSTGMSSGTQKQESRPVTGPMSSGGTLPPPSFGGSSAASGGTGTGGTSTSSSTSGNLGGGSPVETTRGHGAKS